MRYQVNFEERPSIIVVADGFNPMRERGDILFTRQAQRTRNNEWGGRDNIGSWPRNVAFYSGVSSVVELDLGDVEEPDVDGVIFQTAPPPPMPMGDAWEQ